MSFYVTLPSHANRREFPNNQANWFKIRLPHPLRLPGGQWQVGLSAISLPDAHVNLYELMMKGQHVLGIKWHLKIPSQSGGTYDKYGVAVTKIDDIKDWDWVMDGVSFMKAGIAHVEQKRRESAIQGGDVLNDQGKHTYVKFRWEGDNLVIDNTNVCPQSDTYHYKAYIKELLNFDREDGKMVLGPQGWFNQVDFPPQWAANNTDSTTPHNDYRNLSDNHKAALATSIDETAKYAGGVTHSLVFTPHLEVFHTGKVLVPGVEIKMKFHFDSPNLFMNGVALAGRLMEGDVKLRFHLCQLRLNETVYRSLSAQGHNDKQMATYPTVRSEIRTFSMQGNLTRFDFPNLFQNRVPDRLIVALLDSRAFNGDVTRDPFCFQKFGLSSIGQIVRGEEYPYETLHLVHNDAARDNLGYFRFLQASDAWCKKKSNMVELGDWGQGKNCTLFMFDNVANGCADSQRLNPKQTGDLQLSLEFGAAPATNITVLLYGEFENLLEIDSNGAVLYDIYQH